MRWAEMLREQANVLRSLAASRADGVMRQDLIRMAERCEEMAAEAEAGLIETPSNPIDGQTCGKG